MAYSYRLNEGYAPRTEYLEDVADLPEFSLIVGIDDEAFYASKYEEVMSAVTGKGSYHILPGENISASSMRPRQKPLFGTHFNTLNLPCLPLGFHRRLL